MEKVLANRLLIAKKDATEAILHASSISKPKLSKTLKSAVSNAYEKGFTDTSKISVSEAYSTEGPIFKRYKARAMGRATKRYKRTSHITIILKEGVN